MDDKEKFKALFVMVASALAKETSARTAVDSAELLYEELDERGYVDTFMKGTK